MAFTREFIRKAAKESGVELPKEFEDALVNEHITTRDAFANDKVKNALEENKPDAIPEVKETQEYKALKKELDDLKAETLASAEKAKKTTALRKMLSEIGVMDKVLDDAVGITNLDSFSLDDDGNIVDGSKLKKHFSEKFSSFIPQITDVKHVPETPLNNVTGHKMTKEDIFRKDERGRYVLSDLERQNAIRENPDYRKG